MREYERIQAPWKRWMGLGLVVISCLLYAGLLLVPMTSFSTEGKVTLSALLIIFGEVSFWIGGMIIGREVIRRYRKALDPRRWFCGGK